MTGTTATGKARALRFGVVAPLTTDLPTWRDRVRRVADSGYSTLLMPDVPQWQPAPGPTLALAAALTNLRVGTWVYASPVRAGMEHRMGSAFAVCTHRRSLRNGRRHRQARDRGPTPRTRTARGPTEPSGWPGCVKIVMALRDLDGPDLHTPVAMAVRGPKAQALAAEVADTVTFVMRAGLSLGPRWCNWHATFTLSATSNSPCMCR